MARRATSDVPPIKLHKATGQAYVNLNGRRVYLGRFGTSEVEQKYHRVCRSNDLCAADSELSRRGSGQADLVAYLSEFDHAPARNQDDDVPLAGSGG